MSSEDDTPTQVVEDSVDNENPAESTAPIEGTVEPESPVEAKTTPAESEENIVEVSITCGFID
jgi:hypothetical protein